jgi:(p)ppGpp synthase/HD superfamily hydrolase
MSDQMGTRFAGEVESAESIATRVHEFQTDKAGKAYIDHPRRVVANLVSHPDFVELSRSEQSAATAAAWLHDVVEDSGTNGHPHVSLDDLSKADISPLAIRIIERMTRPEDKASDVQNAYYVAIANDPLAQLCKWSDIADNLNEQRLAALPEALQLKARAKYAHALRLMPMNAIQKEWLNSRIQIAVD